MSRYVLQADGKFHGGAWSRVGTPEGEHPRFYFEWQKSDFGEWILRDETGKERHRVTDSSCLIYQHHGNGNLRDYWAKQIMNYDDVPF